jgi:hypothetical protein
MFIIKNRLVLTLEENKKRQQKNSKFIK